MHFAHDRFLFYFQPIMHIRDKTIDHYEVLLRMLDDNGTVLAPNILYPQQSKPALSTPSIIWYYGNPSLKSAEIQHQGPAFASRSTFLPMHFTTLNCYRS